MTATDAAARPPAALVELAARHGVEAEFVDGVGAERVVRAETLVAVLAALGVPIERPDEATPLLAGGAPVMPRCGIAPVGRPAQTPTAIAPRTRVAVTVTLEDGRRRPPLAAVVGEDGCVAVGALPAGVHAVAIEPEDGGAPDRRWQIAAPEQVHPGRLGDRTWGVFSPLASLRADDAPDVGIGNLGALAGLGDVVAARGGSVVGTLPLVACGPEVDSPYSPVSRRFWDERWADPVRLAALLELPAPALHGRPFDERVPIEEAVAAVRGALRELFDGVDGRVPGLDAFASAVPDLDAFARWRAAGHRHGWDVARWPAGLEREVREGRGGGLDPGDVAFERFAQWCVHRQLSELDDRDDVALYLDLPLGLADDAFDMWWEPELFARAVSIGAPPDRFFPWGQRWDLTPLQPVASARDGHRYLRRCLEAHAAVCGLLRIDHVMGLHRQFWMPDGAEPGEGAYVRYPAQELWAILRLVSHRHRCGIVGEDLGTVPDEVRQAMAENGARGLYLAQDELRAPFRLARPVPARCVASIGTHDLEPLAAWWQRAGAAEAGAGIEGDGVAADVADVARAADGAVPAGLVRDHVVAELAVSAADVVLVSEQDLSVDERRFNLPGSSGPENWRARSLLSVADLAGDGDQRAADARRLLTDLDVWRRTERGRLPEGWAPMADTEDLRSLAAGTHARMASRFGVHPITVRGLVGAEVTVWAPNARAVAIAGDFDGFAGTPLQRFHHGLWHGFIPSAMLGDYYKFLVTGPDGTVVQKADPLGRAAEPAPGNASIIAHSEPAQIAWSDGEWMRRRAEQEPLRRPMSIYELHPASWRRDGDRMLNWRELAPLVIEHQRRLGFTHVELMAVLEHPFGGSWGYHVTGYFAPTSRHGTPVDFAAFVDELHDAGIGVILDWVPAHFPADAFGLARFDGGPLYEYADPRIGAHPEWGSLVFDYGRNEVRAFLVSSALWWLEQYHVDGLRVDAVASMLYRDYGRDDDWIPNVYGGRENLEAIDVIRQLTEEIHGSRPGALVIAEESTSWPGVTSPTAEGGLGFDLKWDLGWMHDMLDYLGRDPVHRRWHQSELTFRAMYQDSERFVLPLSHDEVVHGKGPLLDKMAGDRWQQLANLRLLLGNQFTMPGVPLIFQGTELAPYEEWNHEVMPPWFLLDHNEHRGIFAWVKALNDLLAAERALHAREADAGDSGFEWIDPDDGAHSALVYLRRGRHHDDDLLVAATFTPAPLDGYRIGLPDEGSWELALNSDAGSFGGSGYPVADRLAAESLSWSYRGHSAVLTVPPLGMVVYRRAWAR